VKIHTRPLPAAIGILALIIGSSSAAIAAAKNTTSDVKKLASAETRVLSLLHSYKDTAAWKTQFKAAEAAQSADMDRVNSDLGPPPAPSGVLLSISGKGTQHTASFTVPASAGGWHVNWSYSCANFGVGGTGAFGFYVWQGASPVTSGPDQTGTGGSGTTHFYDTGTFSLHVISDCDWTIQVVAGG
jgi:hypothetical protein